MILQNFLLSRAKAELSPHIHHLSKTPGAINQSIKKVTTYIDSIVLECEGVTTKDYLSKRKYEALETILSYLVQEGYSQVKQNHISKKSGISKPVINYVLTWLQDLGVCQQIKVRRHGKIAPSIYILTIHNNYLKIIEYFKIKWAVAIDVCSTFTEFLSGKLFKKSVVANHEDIKNDIQVSSNSVDIYSVNKQEKSNTDCKLKEKNNRLQDLDDYLSEDQKKAYYYILSQELNHLSEKDAYTIALRMPPYIDRYARWDFEECVQWFQYNEAQNSNPAHFIKMFRQKCKENWERRNQNAIEKKSLHGTNKKREFVFYNFLEETN
ncbi:MULTISPECIES: Replicase RepFR55 [Bacillus cereus group]|uniref:Replicase RepFR55 n=1 Tax=Bacillus cereus group TaxID=86661 RepID=UPI000BF6794E|nr:MULTISPECIES: Replicase RepFR55 [Bacillus cereus group]PFV50073.1 Replicase RepFR55 [Bacillus cereus]PGU16094.1 Replicase RepFR55 [Bacillus thuringiensis]